MTKNEIITAAQLYLDDSSELSDSEWSDLFDRTYRKICSDRPWEFTKAEGIGTTSTSVPYISLESDFLYLTQNYNYTDSTSEEASRPVVFVGTEYIPYSVVSWSDRRQYRNQDRIVWIDYPNRRLYFALQPTSAKAVEYDYHKQMAALEAGESPAFPEEFHPVLFHSMVVDNFIIEQSDKARSYLTENNAKAKEYLNNMAYWNAQLIQM